MSTDAREVTSAIATILPVAAATEAAVVIAKGGAVEQDPIDTPCEADEPRSAPTASAFQEPASQAGIPLATDAEPQNTPSHIEEPARDPTPDQDDAEEEREDPSQDGAPASPEASAARSKQVGVISEPQVTQNPDEEEVVITAAPSGTADAADGISSAASAPSERTDTTQSSQPVDDVDDDKEVGGRRASSPPFEPVEGPASAPEPNAPSQTAATQRFKPTHLRIDSVPPKRYEIEESGDAHLQRGHGSGPNPLSPTVEEQEYSLDRESERFQKYANEHLFYGAGHAMDRIVTQLSGVSETSKSGLSFVDVHLEPSLEPGSPMAPPGSPFATNFEGRSSEQIRNDSISSASIVPDGESPMSCAIKKSLDAPASAPASARSSLGWSPSQAFDSPPRSPIHDKPLPGKPIEGRYRGRKVVASSRGASPEARGGTTSEPVSAPRSRRGSRIMSPSNSGELPRKGRGRASSVSTSSSVAAVLSRRLSSVEQPETDKPSHKQLPSIRTENLVPANGGITVIVGDETGREVEILESIPSSDAAGDNATPTRPVATSGKVRSASHQTAKGLDEECQGGAAISTEGSSSKRSIEVNGHSAAPQAGQEPPPVPFRSTSVSGNISPSMATEVLSTGLTDKADQPQDGNSRRRRSSAANAESIESRTRMTTLPPKQKAEEIKHRVDFEKMMMMHKELERKRQEELEEKRRQKEEEQRASLVRWEKEILPSWTRARKDEELRKLWWKGAPPSIRGRVWALAIGNAMMLPRNLLEQAEKRIAPPGQGGGDRREIPAAVMRKIEEDIAEALPSLKLFQKFTGPLYDDLLRICRAFVLVRMEQVDEMTAAGNADRSAARMQAGHLQPQASSDRAQGETVSDDPMWAQDEYTRRGIQLYQRGLSTLSAILLINLPATTAFICLLNLINSKAWLKALYSLSPTVAPSGMAGGGPRGRVAELSPKEKGIRGFERVFETLLADQMPKVYANLLAQNVNIHACCVRDWATQLWGSWLDCDTVMRLWDVVLLDETDSLIYRTSLALVQTLESRLYVPDRAELESVLRGTNRAALSIWRRDKELSGELSFGPSPSSSSEHLSSSTSTAPAPAPAAKTRRDSANEVVPKDYIYEQYGIREETIFDALEEQKAWWKPSTLSRLLDRELGE
ncbi:hypothetical protein ACQY0O_001600 [Thecaphora frezii]